MRENARDGETGRVLQELHVAVSRAFVEFLMTSPVALAFRDWLKDTGVPDETLFASLIHSPGLGVPGAYTGNGAGGGKMSLKQGMTSIWKGRK